MNADNTPDKVYLAATACAVPDLSITQEQAVEFVRNHFEGKLKDRSMAIMEKVLRHPSITKRHFAFSSPEVLLEENPDQRIARFTEGAIGLSCKAIKEAVSRTGLKIERIGGLVVNTCTGYICPGLSTYIIERLGLNPSIRSYDLVGSGCGGAIPNFQVCEGLLKGSADDAVLSVSVEICSSTFQSTDDPSQLVSNSIFGDGATASVLWKRPQGLLLVGSESRYIPGYREDVRFYHKNGQLHNRLSSRLPSIAGKAVSQMLREFLGRRGLMFNDIKHWALHPGGENVINSLRDEIGIPEDKLEHTRSVLSSYGNMSSPTVLFILNEILKLGINPGDYVLMASFGAGFSEHAYLLQSVS